MMNALRRGQTMVEYIIIVALIAIGKKTAGATEALSAEEGNKAKSAAENINENTIKNLGE